VGTGIGDGDRGVICGRESQCSGAKEREQETDCDAEDAQNDETNPWSGSASSSTNNPSQRPGYARHQVEGIGGRMTNKLVRMVKVGQCVTQWEDEKRDDLILAREVEGRSRSWCGWCWRAIPGAKDWKGS